MYSLLYKYLIDYLVNFCKTLLLFNCRKRWRLWRKLWTHNSR